MSTIAERVSRYLDRHGGAEAIAPLEVGDVVNCALFAAELRGTMLAHTHAKAILSAAAGRHMDEAAIEALESVHLIQRNYLGLVVYRLQAIAEGASS